MCAKHLWKDAILNKVVGKRPGSLLKMSLFHGCLSHISVTWFLRRREVCRNWVNTPNSLRVRNFLRFTTLCQHYVTNAKKTICFKSCVFVLYNPSLPCRRSISELKYYFKSSHEVSCTHLCTLFL